MFFRKKREIEAIHFKYKYAGKIVSITGVSNEED